MSKCDHSIFYGKSNGGLILLVVYVDDIVVVGSNVSISYKRVRLLEVFFGYWGWGVRRYFLMLEKNMLLDLLGEIEKLGAKPCNAPVTPNLQLFAEDNEPFANFEMYKRLIGN